MKGKRPTTEAKIRALGEADGGRAIREVCQERNLSEATSHRWRKQFGLMEVDEAPRLAELSLKHPRYGYRRIAKLLRKEGWVVGKRWVPRWRRHAGLRGPPTRRTIARRGHSTGLPTQALDRGQVWTWDFIADATVRGGALRILTILDEHTRECPVLRADRALQSKDVLAGLQKAIGEHGAPAWLRSDHGPEFIANIVPQWRQQNGVRTLSIEPGSPWQNGFVESFHGRFRDECLNREQLHTLTEARVVIGDYRQEYNTLRPHCRLGYLSPTAYARLQPPSPAPLGLRPPATGDGQITPKQPPSTNP